MIGEKLDEFDKIDCIDKDHKEKVIGNCIALLDAYRRESGVSPENCIIVVQTIAEKGTSIIYLDKTTTPLESLQVLDEVM